MFGGCVYQSTQNILRREILLNQGFLEEKGGKGKGKKKISKGSNNHPEEMGIVSKYLIYYKQVSSFLE